MPHRNYIYQYMQKYDRKGFSTIFFSIVNYYSMVLITKWEITQEKNVYFNN